MRPSTKRSRTISVSLPFLLLFPTIFSDLFVLCRAFHLRQRTFELDLLPLLCLVATYLLSLAVRRSCPRLTHLLHPILPSSQPTLPLRHLHPAFAIRRTSLSTLRRTSRHRSARHRTPPEPSCAASFANALPHERCSCRAGAAAAAAREPATAGRSSSVEGGRWRCWELLVERRRDSRRHGDSRRHQSSRSVSAGSDAYAATGIAEEDVLDGMRRMESECRLFFFPSLSCLYPLPYRFRSPLVALYHFFPRPHLLLTFLLASLSLPSIFTFVPPPRLHTQKQSQSVSIVAVLFLCARECREGLMTGSGQQETDEGILRTPRLSTASRSQAAPPFSSSCAVRRDIRSAGSGFVREAATTERASWKVDETLCARDLSVS